MKKAFLCAVVSLLATGDRFLLPAINDKKELKAPETQVLRFFVDTLVITKANCDSCLTMAQYQKTTDAITSFFAKVDSTDMKDSQKKNAEQKAFTINFGLKKNSSLLHEGRHKHNYTVYKKIQAKYYKPGVAFLLPQDKAELDIHDEISGNLAQLFYARDLFRKGFSLDSIPIPSEAYKTFLKNHPKLPKKISSEELEIFALKADEWVHSYQNYYSTAHGINIALYIDKDLKNKTYPSPTISSLIAEEIMSQYYTFSYHGQLVSVSFKRLNLSENVKDVIAEKESASEEAPVLTRLKNSYKERKSYAKEGNGKLYASQPLPNYNPNINSL